MPLSDGLDTRPCKILDPRLASHIHLDIWMYRVRKIVSREVFLAIFSQRLTILNKMLHAC